MVAYKIGFPIDAQEDSHLITVKLTNSKEHYVKNGLSSQIKENSGSYLIASIAPPQLKQLKYEFEIIPHSKLSPRRMIDVGTSDAAACYFAMRSYPKTVSSNAKIVLISASISGLDFDNARLEPLNTDKESLCNKLSAAKNHGAIALFLHDRDAQKLQENCKIEALLPHCLDNAKPGDPTVISCQSDDVTLLGQIIGLPMPRKKLNKAWIYALILLGIAALALLCYFFALPEYPRRLEIIESDIMVRIIPDPWKRPKTYTLRLETVKKVNLFITQIDGAGMNKPIFPPVKVNEHEEFKLKNPVKIGKYTLPSEDYSLKLDGTPGMEKLYCFYSKTQKVRGKKFYMKYINKLPKRPKSPSLFYFGDDIYCFFRRFTVK